MGDWQDGYWQSPDGLRLHYRDYPGDASRVPVLCIPGLTRNVRDFEAVADRLSGGRRVITIELRGRGASDYSPDPKSYNPMTYASDVKALLDQLGLEKVALFGTSLGGIITMLLSAFGEPRLAGYLLNDIGPTITEAGLVRIRAYVGASHWPDWEAAAAAIATTHATAYPDHTAADWAHMARQLCREEGGAIVTDYDPAIAELVRQPSAPPPEPWKLIEGLQNLPGLLVSGALSDILAPEVAAEMAQRLPEMEWLELPTTGHAPTLDEPDVRIAIDRLLARIDARAF